MKRSKRAAKARLRKLGRVFERAIIPKDVLQQHRSMERRNPPKIKGRKVKGGRAVSVRNFTGTVTKTRTGQVLIVGRGRKA